MIKPLEPKLSAVPETLFAGGGEMGALMRARFACAEGNVDGAQSNLGAIDTWSQSLKTAIGIILGSRYPMFIWWGQDLINFYNDAYIPMLGKRHPQALGKPAVEIWTDIWHLVGSQAADVLNHGTPSWNVEFLEIVERNGYPEETYFTFSYSPIHTEDGSVGGVFCACTEDTQRVIDDRRLGTLRELASGTTNAKSIEEACEISTTVFAGNLKDIPFALIYLIQGNQARLVSTTNLDSETLVSPRVIELGDDASDCWLLHSVVARRETQVIDQLIDRLGALPGGAWQESPHQAIVLPLTRPGQETLGVLIAGINPYQLLDENYRGFFDLVAGQVTTAIANSLAYEEDRKRTEGLAELDRTKITFFNNVSHELRTPLTLILTPAEDALSDRANPLSPDQRQRLEVIQRNGLRLLKLVNTLLDFSRTEADRLQALYEPTDLATLTMELASVFRSAIERANLEFIVDCPPLPEPVYVDREMWEKIVLNLLSNALKFTFTGQITVRLHPVRDQVELSVQDTGIGIPAAEIPHLFKRFYRVKDARGRTFEGSGIGLSLCQELVKLHGGTIQVSSTEGEGSCFRVLIPTGCAHLPVDRIGTIQTLPSSTIGAVPYVEEALRWLPEEEGNREQGTGNRERRNTGGLPADRLMPLSSSPQILLVDDNADMRDYLQRLLSQRWQVETAENGAIALQLIQQQPPDLVLTDVMMPEMDGFQLLQALRADPSTQSIPVILLSARAGEAATIEGLEAGADDYLIKPFSARELIARVETQLQMSRLRQEESANRFKTEFLRTVTHELQSPLTAILGWARLLQARSFDPATTARALSTIERNALIEAKLVKDLLDVSAILSGKLSLKPQLVELVPLVQNGIADFRKTAEAKQIRLIEKISDLAQRTILADGDRLRQILANLLDNAIKFTPDGGKVTIQADCTHSEIQITVSDTGIGIRPDFLPNVFDRFSQAEVPSHHSPGGVGIGLAIAHHLVQLHHGTIEAKSAGKGQGSTFIVRLPLLE